jgi:hypothetical protein
MLDNPEKATKLLAALKAAVPFEVELTDRLIKQLRAQHHASADQNNHTVSDLSYAGDEGGIVCHIVPPEKQKVIGGAVRPAFRLVPVGHAVLQ